MVLFLLALVASVVAASSSQECTVMLQPGNTQAGSDQTSERVSTRSNMTLVQVSADAAIGVSDATDAASLVAARQEPKPNGSNPNTTGLNNSVIHDILQFAGSYSLRVSAVEFMTTTIFIFSGCLSVTVMEQKAETWVLQVSLAFGLATALLVRTTGCQLNCAVTFGLWLLGYVSLVQGFLNFIAQMIGSIMGAALVACIMPVAADASGRLATNVVNLKSFSVDQAMMMEFLLTFMLMFVTACTLDPAALATTQDISSLSIGLAVFLAHSVLVPIDGCSINPNRSFGPALVAKWRQRDISQFTHFHVFVVGPMAGAIAAAAVYYILL